MKIAMVMFELSSEFGGILNWMIHLAKGLEETGHEPTIFYIRPTKSPEFRIRDIGGKSALHDSGYGLQIRVHASGSRGRLAAAPEICRSCYEDNAEEVRDELAEYDGVIVVWPPSYRDNHSGFHTTAKWKTVLKHGKPQVVIAHDAHWARVYPWIIGIKDHIDCLVGVHPAAYDSIKNWPGKIVNIFNAFDIRDSEKDYSKKRMDWVCNTAFFKKWKHNEDGIRASCYLDPVHIFYTGTGIEISNMQADFEDEAHIRKNAKYYWKKGDPSVKEEWIGEKIWSVAETVGNFHYLGLVTNEKVRDIQAICGGLTEFAYHPKWGEHWNRALIEGMIRHCIPFARQTGALSREGGVFSKDNVVLIPEDASPKKIAHIIKDAMKDNTLYKQLVKRNLGLLHHFDRRRIALQYVRLLKGKDPHAYQGPEMGEADEVTEKFLSKFCVRRFPRPYRYPRD